MFDLTGFIPTWSDAPWKALENIAKKEIITGSLFAYVRIKNVYPASDKVQMRRKNFKAH